MKLIIPAVWAGVMVMMQTAASGNPGKAIVTATASSSAQGYAEITGVRAGAFDAEAWTAGPPNLVPDIRRPLMEPREGTCRNIYAPSAVETAGGWRVFYGAWDGVPTCNDRIYSALTKDFLQFTDRHTVIEHGPFQHVCNVNAIRLPDGAWRMLCTAYPDKSGRNKPALFSSPDGKTWNGHPEPYTASFDDIVTVSGYANYPDADINGMNVLLFDGGKYTMYFGDFRRFGKVYTATSADGRSYTYDGVALEGAYAVNDIKKFKSTRKTWYLMGLHMNTDKLYYSLSDSRESFPPVKLLQQNIDSRDRYIVAVGWVTQGDQETRGRRLLGYLYGAGPDAALASNRIFATWLQKKVVLVRDDGRRVEAASSRGPDRQLFALGETFRGHAEVYAEDGRTLLARSGRVEMAPGHVYNLRIAD